MHELFHASRRRFLAVASEFELSPPQVRALGVLDPERPVPMSELADALHCDNSNITGIVDRLEAAGLAERRPSERDRRVKAVVLTDKGEWMRVEIERRVGQPPPRLATLPEKDAVALRDILARALED